MRCCSQAVDKAGACGHQVKSPSPLRANLILYQAGGRRKQHIGRDRAHQNGVEIGGTNASLLQSSARRQHRHIGCCNFRRRNVTFTDTCAVHDPLVVGIDHALQVLIRQNARGAVTAQRRNFRLVQITSG